MTMLTEIVTRDVAEIISEALPWEEFKGARVLVTGANGMIPSVAVLTLLAANQQYGLGLVVHALARNGARAREVYGEFLERSDLVLWEQDVTAPLPATPSMTHIIHGASAAQPKKHSVDPVGTLNANIKGTQNLLDAARAWDSRSFALMSSSEIYGDTSHVEGMITENDYGPIDILNPRACYSEGKRASETLAAVYSAQFGIPFTAARFGHIYGPGLDVNDGRVQADFARDVLNGNDITLKSAGLAQRTYTYVSDAVTGLFTAILRGESGAYNVSDSAGLVSIRQLAEHFVQARPAAKLELKFETDADQYATNTVEFLGLDSAKLSELGWAPKVTLTDGVDRFLAHLEQTK